MMNMPDLVSVIIPVFNRASQIERSIRSCLEQTHPTVEVIVVNDGSTDTTQEVVKRLQKEFGEDRLRYFYQANQGPSAARNKGLDLCRGEYVQFLDSDDYLDLHKFSLQIERMRSQDAQACTCGFVYVEDATGKRIREDSNDDGAIASRLSRFRGIQTGVTLMKRSSIPAALRFPPECFFYEDRDFFFQYFLGIKKAAHVPEYLLFYVQHKLQLSSKLPRRPDCERHFWTSWEYWKKQKSVIPKENRWMLKALARNLMVQAYLQRDLGAAIRLSRRFILMGGGINEVLQGMMIMAKSLVLIGFKALGRAQDSEQKHDDWR